MTKQQREHIEDTIAMIIDSEDEPPTTPSLLRLIDEVTARLFAALQLPDE